MNTLFGTDEMAAGYARFRPAVHPLILGLVAKSLQRDRPFRLALDIGCGAGLSTRALDGFAAQCVGLDPAETMLRRARATAPRAHFVAGAAEAIPAGDGSIDLITAAGSLNYVQLERFFPEAARVLAPKGVLVVYDFSAARSFRQGSELDEWFTRFMRRFPAPAGEARELNPEILAQLATGFRVAGAQYFELGLTVTPEFYLDYMLTETNVASAVRQGVALSVIRSWCAETLAPVWRGGEREVLFRGYFVCMMVA